MKSVTMTFYRIQTEHSFVVMSAPFVQTVPRKCKVLVPIVVANLNSALGVWFGRISMNNFEAMDLARGIPVYAALRELGREGVADLVERTSRHCHTIVTEIGNLPGAKMIWEPRLNQGLVRFLDQRPNATEADHDAKTDAIIAAINADGEAFFSSTTWNGQRAMRVSVVNWRTDENDVKRTVSAVRRILSQT